MEKVPLNTPLEKKGARFRNPDNLEVFFTTVSNVSHCDGYL